MKSADLSWLNVPASESTVAACLSVTCVVYEKEWEASTEFISGLPYIYD